MALYKLLKETGKKVIKKISDKKLAKEAIKKADAELDKKLFNKDGSFKMDPNKLLDEKISTDKDKTKKIKEFYSGADKKIIQERTLNFKGGLIRKPKLAKKGWK
tara:strand:- start:191 stop:502 length:312 start_codon:yes stop_codon:yes gene_type:complete